MIAVLVALVAAVTASMATPGLAAEPAELADVEVHRDLPYVAHADGQTLDVYVPRAAAKPVPVLLFFHGGGWIVGNKGAAVPEADRSPHLFPPGRAWPSLLPFLQRGIAVVSVDYRLAPLWPAPAAVDDALAAVRWLAAHGADYGLDPSRIVTVGASAGGHLALQVAFTSGSGQGVIASGQPTSSIVGAIDLYGVTDVADLLHGKNEREWAQQWVPEQPEREELAQRMSPLTHVRPGVPPVLIVHSEADDVVPLAHAERLARALADAGVAVELVKLRETPHGFFSPSELAIVDTEIVRFLDGLHLLSAAPATAGTPAAPAPTATAR